MVAQIIWDLTKDENIIIAGLLHDIVKHTTLTEAGLLAMFNTSITSIVLGSMSLHQDLKRIMNTYPNWQEYIKKQDQRVIQITLADVLHNIRTIKEHSKYKQMHIMNNFMKYYVPLAQTVGLIQLAKELILHCENSELKK